MLESEILILYSSSCIVQGTKPSLYTIDIRNWLSRYLENSLCFSIDSFLSYRYLECSERRSYVKTYGQGRPHVLVRHYGTAPGVAENPFTKDVSNLEMSMQAGSQSPVIALAQYV